MQAFRLTERDLAPGCREIKVEGELDLAVADQLQEALKGASEHAMVLIGLESCEFIDSTGIAVIVRAHRAMTDDGRRLAIHGPQRQVERILSITGLTSNGLVFERAEEARSALG